MVDLDRRRHDRVEQQRGGALGAEPRGADGRSERLGRLGAPERRPVGREPLARGGENRLLEPLVPVVQAHARCATFSAWILRCAAVVARDRQRRLLAAGAQRLQVGAVLAEDRRRARAVHRRAVTGHDVLGLLDQRLEAVQRRDIGVRGAVQPRDLDRRQVVADHQHARPGHPDRHPVLGVALRRLQLELAIADLELARHRKPLRARQRQRPRPLDVELLVELTHGALRGAGLADQPRRGRLGAAERGFGKRVAAEHVVPVAVRSEQADDGEARLLGERRQRSRARPERSASRCRTPRSPDAHERASGLVDPGGGDDDVCVEPDGPHAAPEQLRGLEQVLDLGRRLLGAGVELLAAAVDPDHGDLGLHARLDVVVVAVGDVHPALLAADPPLGLLEVGRVRLVGAHLLRGHDEVEVGLEVAAREAEQLVVDVGDQTDLELLGEALELRCWSP